MYASFHFPCSFFRLTIQEQQGVIMDEYRRGWAARAEQDPEDEIIKSGEDN